MESNEPKETATPLAETNGKQNFFVMVAAAAVILGAGMFSFMGGRTPECDDRDVLKLTKQLFAQEYERSVLGFAILAEFAKKDITDFSEISEKAVIKEVVNEMRSNPKYAPAFQKIDEALDTIEIVNIRASGVEKEINRVSCKAEVRITDEGRGRSFPIEYSAQRTKNGDLFVEM